MKICPDCGKASDPRTLSGVHGFIECPHCAIGSLWWQWSNPGPGEINRAVIDASKLNLSKPQTSES